MQKGLLSICLLLASLSPVISLTCAKCRIKATTCEGNLSEVCPRSTTCTSSVMDNNMDLKDKAFTYRGCVDAKACRSGDYSISSANGKYLQMKTACCNTNRCNVAPVFVTPREDISPNGLQCEACYGSASLGLTAKCTNEETVSCLGNETKCVDFSTRAEYMFSFGKNLKLKGCATEDVCALNGKRFNFERLKFFNVVAKCSDAMNSSKQIDS